MTGGFTVRDARDDELEPAGEVVAEACGSDFVPVPGVFLWAYVLDL